MRCGATCIIFAWALIGPAPACTLSEAAQTRLSASEAFRGGSGFHIYRGLIYDEAQCLEEAEVSFKQAVQVLANVRTPERTEAAAMLEFVGAERSVKAGKQLEAITHLWSIVRTVRSPNAFPRATMLLASILPAAETAGWEELTSYLAEVSKNFQNWNALFLLRRQQFERDRTGAIDAVEKELSETRFSQQRGALETLLAELYFRSGRASESQALLNSIEDEIGETMTDIGLRRRFLELGKDVWEAAARNDPRQAERAAAYARFLKDFNARASKIF